MSKLEYIPVDFLDGACIITQGERVVYINSKASEILGEDSSEIVGKSIFYYISMSDERYKGFLKKNDEFDQEEIEGKVINGVNHQKNIKITCKKSQNLDFTNTLLVLSPVGEIKNTSAKEEVNSDFKEFVYIVSHDLKAPLRAILALVDWLQSDYKEQLDEEGSELIDLIGNRTNRLGGMLEGLIQYSRLLNNEESDAPINVKQLIEKVISSNDVPDGITITIEEDISDVVGKRSKIEMLYGQLIKNCLMFLGRETGKIHIGFDRKKSAFFVQDDGPGIDHEHKDRVFQIFQTLKPKDEVDTTGVGLTLARKVAEMHGGKMWLDTENVSGTKILFTLGG